MALPVKLVNFCLEKVRSFSEYLPYVTYHEGFYHLIDNSRGMIFECRPLPGAGSETERVLSGLFSIPLPVRSTIQVSLLSLPVSEASLNRILEGRVRLQGLIRKKVEFLKESCPPHAEKGHQTAPGVRRPAPPGGRAGAAAVPAVPGPEPRTPRHPVPLGPDP